MRKDIPVLRMVLSCLALPGTLALGGTAELKTDTFVLRFATDGRPAALCMLRGNEEVLDARNPSPGFYLSGPDEKRTPLNDVAVGDNGRLIAR